MQPKKKKCQKCGEMKYIWKRINGLPYCKFCSLQTSSENVRKPQQPLSPRSSKRQRQERAYSILRRSYLTAHPMCEAHLDGCTLKSTQVHHKKGRVGELLTDDKYFLAVCHECHEWIERHPHDAVELGFSIKRIPN